MKTKYPLATSTWDGKELLAMERVISSGRFTMGSEVEDFEKQFAKYFGSKYAVMVNSGSSANLLMTSALFYTKNPKYRFAAGDEIIVPAVSWPTTYTPLSQYGLNLKFVDIDLETLNYDLRSLKNALSDKTRAIMVVNLLGNPNDFDEIRRMISGSDIFLLEDNCESMGAVFDGRSAGTFGVMGTFSSFFSHHISTMEGGIVVTDDEELYHIMLVIRAHGWTRSLPDVNQVANRRTEDAFEESFRFVLPGYNLRPLELSGAIGKEQLLKLPRLIEGRRENARLFKSCFTNHSQVLIQKEVGDSSWFGFSLVLKPTAKLNRSQLIKKLINAGFECRPIVAGNFAKKEVMQFLKHAIHGGLANADYVDQHGLFVGNHHYPIEDAINDLEKCVGV